MTALCRQIVSVARLQDRARGTKRDAIREGNVCTRAVREFLKRGRVLLRLDRWQRAIWTFSRRYHSAGGNPLECVERQGLTVRLPTSEEQVGRAVLLQ
jgi:hypothetical protein